jgi:hypothetical protein
MSKAAMQALQQEYHVAKWRKYMGPLVRERLYLREYIIQSGSNRYWDLNSMQLATNALRNGDHVMWVDSASHFPSTRFEDFLRGSKRKSEKTSPELEEPDPDTQSLLRNVDHFTCPSFAHLLALVLHTSSSFPPEKTTLLVVDNISNLLSIAFPRDLGDKSMGSNSKTGKSDAAQWIAQRKFKAMEGFVSKLSVLAATKRIAVLLIQQATTRMKEYSAAILVPSISSTVWDLAVSTRLVLFRDFCTNSIDTAEHLADNKKESSRLIGVQKVGGVIQGENGGIGKLVSFVITKVCLFVPWLSTHLIWVQNGLAEVDFSESLELATQSAMGPPLKRKREEIEDSLSEGDSDDEDYGWDDNETSVAVLDNVYDGKSGAETANLNTSATTWSIKPSRWTYWCHVYEIDLSIAVFKVTRQYARPEPSQTWKKRGHPSMLSSVRAGYTVQLN